MSRSLDVSFVPKQSKCHITDDKNPVTALKRSLGFKQNDIWLSLKIMQSFCPILSSIA